MAATQSNTDYQRNLNQMYNISVNESRIVHTMIWNYAYLPVPVYIAKRMLEDVLYSRDRNTYYIPHLD